MDLCRAYNKGSGPVASTAIQIKSNNSDTFLIWGYLGIKLLEAYDFDIQSAMSHIQLSLTTWFNKLPLGRWEPQLDSRVSFKDLMLAFVVISFPCAQIVLKGMKGTSYSDGTWPAWELCLEDNCTIFTAIFVILQLAIQALAPTALCSDFTAMWKTIKEKPNPWRKNTWFAILLFFFHREKQNRKKAVLNDRWTQVLTYFKFGQRRI